MPQQLKPKRKITALNKKLKSYNVKMLKEDKQTHFVKTTYQLSKKKKDFITPADIHYILDQLAEKLPKNSKIMIRGLGIDKMHNLAEDTYHQRTTLKGFKDELLSFDDEEEYLDGMVEEAKDKIKFLRYFQIEFTIIKPIITTPT